jgi:predicted dinucleotide-binding enzyme
MTIAIIGAGTVGLTLGKALARHGEAVAFGLSSPAKYAADIAAIPNARALGIEAAVEQAELILLAVPYAAAASVAEAIPDWGGRILVDLTNPLAPGLAGLTLGTDTSGAEQTAARAHNARVVKAFNTTGAENMANPTYPAGRTVMPVCGDDTAARQRVMALAETLGFEAVDFGPLAGARLLEPMALVWIQLALKYGQGRDFAFGLLRR